MNFLVKHLVTSRVIQVKKALIDLAVPLAKDISPKLATKATSTILDKFEIKISGQGTIRARK